MRIAYLILCHVDADHIARLVRKITEGTEHTAFVHVDAKTDNLPFQKALSGCPNVKLCSRRTKVYWGGYSAVAATIDLMQEALAEGDFDRFVLLQGLEYPIKRNSEIREFFERHPQTEFLLAQNISKSQDPRQIHKYRLYYWLDKSQLLPVKIVHKLNSLCLSWGHLPKCKPNYVRDAYGRRMEIYQGCAQFGLTREAVAYIVKFHGENSAFQRYFRSVYAADEAYFHTILYNSAFAARTPDGKGVDRPHLTDFANLTYFEYPDEVTVFKTKDCWQKLKDSGFLFFRKANSESKELLDHIDHVHQHNQNGS